CAFSSKYKKPNLVVLNDINNEDFYYNEAIYMNIFDEINKSKEIQKKEKKINKCY
ncbi:16130_t:CDS:1, partial [Gigaspora margarita]